jgi:hypothetical protein
VTNSTGSTLDVAVGGVVQVQLVSSSYDRSGQTVPWQQPSSSNPSVLGGSRPPTVCPPRATCANFVARAAGEAVLSAVGPTGAICHPRGVDCVMVMPIIKRVVVLVSA